MQTLKRIHVIVRGRVQGVYYRASTQHKAEELALAGWVRNLDNGDVEFEAQGDEEKLEALLSWAQEGPENARVDSIVCANCAPRSEEIRFRILI